jgi:putative membrane protein
MTFNVLPKNISIFAATALLAAATAFAQVQPGAGAPPGGAQTSPNAPQPGLSPSTNNPGADDQAMKDKAFVRDSLEGGMAEVQLGQLAAQKASSDDVKQFGQKMVDDHAKIDNAMTQVAQQVGIKPPEKISKKDRELVAKLQGLSGPQFDDAYIKAMVKDHKKDQSSFQMEAQDAQNPAVRQVAEQGAPLITSHLQTIEQIAQAHNVQGGKSKANGQ